MEDDARSVGSCVVWFAEGSWERFEGMLLCGLMVSVVCWTGHLAGGAEADGGWCIGQPGGGAFDTVLVGGCEGGIWVEEDAWPIALASGLLLVKIWEGCSSHITETAHLTTVYSWHPMTHLPRARNASSIVGYGIGAPLTGLKCPLGLERSLSPGGNGSTRFPSCTYGIRMGT